MILQDLQSPKIPYSTKIHERIHSAIADFFPGLSGELSQSTTTQQSQNQGWDFESWRWWIHGFWIHLGKKPSQKTLWLFDFLLFCRVWITNVIQNCPRNETSYITQKFGEIFHIPQFFLDLFGTSFMAWKPFQHLWGGWFSRFKATNFFKSICIRWLRQRGMVFHGLIHWHLATDLRMELGWIFKSSMNEGNNLWRNWSVNLKKMNVLLAKWCKM